MSCKSCTYHLCTSCGHKRAEQMLNEEIMLTVYRAAQPGLLPGMSVEEDTWQVRIVRGATVGALKVKISELYGLPAGLQALRRDVDGTPMADTELLAYDEGDVIHLSAAGGPGGLPAGLLVGLGGAGGAAGLGGLANALSGALAEAETVVSRVMAQVAEKAKELEKSEYNLTLVLQARGAPKPPRPERRCKLVVMATARAMEVLEMAKLELNAENEALALEFAGQKLPPGMPVHALGLSDGDTVMIVPEDPRTRTS